MAHPASKWTPAVYRDVNSHNSPWTPDSLTQLHGALRRCEGYSELGMWHAAWEELEELPNESRSALPVIIWRMKVLMGLGFWQSASSLGLSLVERWPGKSEIRALTAESLRETGRAEEAVALMRSGAECSGHDPAYWYASARLEVLVGNESAAKEAVHRCVELDPRLRREILKSPELRGLV